MTKTDFMNQLRLNLYGLPSTEIEDIVRDQEEFIREAMAAGRSENEVLRSLGSPVDLAKNLKAEIKIEKAQEQKDFSGQLGGFFVAVGAVLVLAPFNLIFVLGPLLLLMGLVFGGWTLAVALSSVFFILFFIAFVLVIFSPAGFALHAALVFAFLSVALIGLALIGLMYYVTKGLMNLVLRRRAPWC